MQYTIGLQALEVMKLPTMDWGQLLLFIGPEFNRKIRGNKREQPN